MYFDSYFNTSLRYIDISFKNLLTVVASRPVRIYFAFIRCPFLVVRSGALNPYHATLNTQLVIAISIFFYSSSRHPPFRFSLSFPFGIAKVEIFFQFARKKIYFFSLGLAGIFMTLSVFNPAFQFDGKIPFSASPCSF